MDTLYDLLGALADDDAEDIRAAFRKAVKSAHPDINPGDPDAALKFRRIVRANEILVDPDQRAVYDHLLDLARIEQDTASKHAVAIAVHKLASGTMALAAVSVVAIAGYLVFMQISSASVAPPADAAWKSFQSAALVAARPSTAPGDAKGRDSAPAKSAVSNPAASSLAISSPAPSSLAAASPAVSSPAVSSPMVSSSSGEAHSPAVAAPRADTASAPAIVAAPASTAIAAASDPAPEVNRNDAPGGPVADLYLEPKFPVAYLESNLILYTQIKPVEKAAGVGHAPKLTRMPHVEPPLTLTAPPPRQMAAQDPSREENLGSIRSH